MISEHTKKDRRPGPLRGSTKQDSAEQPRGPEAAARKRRSGNGEKLADKDTCGSLKGQELASGSSHWASTAQSTPFRSHSNQASATAHVSVCMPSS